MYQSVLTSRLSDFGSLLIHFIFPRFSKDRMQYFVDYRLKIYAGVTLFPFFTEFCIFLAMQVNNCVLHHNNFFNYMTLSCLRAGYSFTHLNFPLEYLAENMVYNQKILSETNIKISPAIFYFCKCTIQLNKHHSSLNLLLLAF